MKNQLKSFLLAVITFTCLSACENEDVLMNGIEDKSAKEVSSNEKLATQLARRMIGLGTRAVETPSVEYILRSNRTFATRAGEEVDLPDTLAYIFNFPSESGWAVIANKNGTDMERILAYSETGNFDSKNKFLTDIFLSNIEPYMLVNPGPTQPIDTIRHDVDVVQMVEPVFRTRFGIYSPLNQYFLENSAHTWVDPELLNALALLMHTQKQLACNKTIYNLENMLAAYRTKHAINSVSEPNISPNPVGAYTYDTACAAMSRILFQMGIDKGMNLEPDGTLFEGGACIGIASKYGLRGELL